MREEEVECEGGRDGEWWIAIGWCHDYRFGSLGTCRWASII